MNPRESGRSSSEVEGEGTTESGVASEERDAPAGTAQALARDGATAGRRVCVGCGILGTSTQQSAERRQHPSSSHTSDAGTCRFIAGDDLGVWSQSVIKMKIVFFSTKYLILHMEPRLT